jgi:predicted ATPase/class 3 adenylate cyclase
MASLPIGTVTFLFTDLESSTRKWEEHPEAMTDALARHDQILRNAVEAHDGVVFSTMGDGIAAVFASAPDAVAAVIALQRDLGTEPWSEHTGPLRARTGLHTDEGRLRAPDQYMNQPLNRCARLMATAHGGQVLVSDATAALVRANLPDDTHLIDLGEHRLRDLSDPMHVFQVVHLALTADFPPIRSLDALPGNLPTQPTDLVGRDDLLADLAQLLRTSHLVTLTGVGGVGKTRVAIQVAADLVPEYRDGAWLCELAPVIEPDGMPDALASPFKLQPRPGQTLTDTVIDFLRAKQTLLVLDNCEHLLDAVAPVVDRIGRDCPRVVVLATSREGLAVRGERIVAVPSLPVDDAARMFVERGSDARAGFVMTADNEVAIRQLCERLDGIPLAVELAAARLRSMSAQEVLDRIDRRFRLLTGGSRTALERHRTLQATVDWSYELLSETERCVFDRLAVFAGGFALEAGEAVVSDDAVDALDVFDLLAQLVDKSLVVVDERAGVTRYRMLETIRQYAQERLEQVPDDAASARRRHAAHYVAFVEAAAPHLYGPEQLDWADRIWADLDNLRAAMAWIVLTVDVDLGIRLVVAANVNGIRLSHVALDWAETVLDLPGVRDHPKFPEAVGWAAWAAVYRADMDRAAALVDELEAAFATSGTLRPAASYQSAITYALFTGDLDTAIARAEACAAAATRDGDDYQRVQALTMVAAASQQRDLAGATATMETAVELARRVGAPGILSWGLSVLGVFLAESDPERALVVMLEAEALCRLVGNDYGAAQALAGRALAYRRLGDFEAELRANRRAWEFATAVGARLSVAIGLAGAAFALADLGDIDSAVRLLGYSGTVFHDFWGTGEPYRAEVLASALGALGPDRVDALTREGATLSDEAAVALAERATVAVLSETMTDEGNE